LVTLVWVMMPLSVRSLLSPTSPRGPGRFGRVANAAPSPTHKDRKRGRTAQEQARARARAKALFIKAERKYAVGKFEQARRLFTAAYEALPLPGFLFNIAQCLRMLGRCERALFFYRGYLRKRPRARNADQVGVLIRECEKKMAEQARAASRRRPQSRARPGYLPARPGDGDGGGVGAGDSARNRDGSRAGPPLYERWWLWTVVGVGLAALATGLGVGLSTGPRYVVPAGTLGTVDGR
jgi:tetratricopeptide (TPR) repeat protein